MKFQLLTLLSLLSFQLSGQVGISVSPPRIYFELNPGQTGTKKISVTNVSSTTELDLAISLGDWDYDPSGENILEDAGKLPISCAGWVSINQSNYFSLKPGQTKDVEIMLTVPRNLDSKPVHTALLYVTQMNPTDDITNPGANIKVSVRSAVKIYHRTLQSKQFKIDIQNLTFNKETKKIDLEFQNLGNTWIDGNIYLDIMNNQTGKQERLSPSIYYTLPNNKRKYALDLPKDLQKGRYTATVIVEYEDQNNIEAAELGFTYE